MKRGFLVTVAAIFIATTFIATPVFSSDYGCKVILCLANPGGPLEFQECVPPITRLYRDLKKGRSMPTCNEANANGYYLDQGYQQYLTCSEAYGPGYFPYNNPNSSANPTCSATSFLGRNNKYPDGFAYTKCTLCRKQTGFKQVYKHDALTFKMGWVKVPVYDVKTVKINAKPRYLQLLHQGKPKAKRHFWR